LHLLTYCSDRSAFLEQIGKFIAETLDIKTHTLEDRQLLKSTCKMVGVRAAKLSATAIVAVLSKINRLTNVSVAIDGKID
jgi:hexokinase